MTTASVLVVDDSGLIRAIVRSQLERHGYAVLEAADGTEGLATAARAEPDVVILDIEMPVLDGYAVVEKIRNDPALAHIPVIFLSGRTSLDDVIVGLDAGAHDYLSKPFEPGELLARVRAAVRVKHFADERRERNKELERLAAQLAERNDSLQTANDGLAAANQLKLDLMGMLSHEIGRPLTLIHGHAELLGELLDENRAEQDSLAMISRNVMDLVRMRDEILAMCAADAGRLVADRSPVALAQAIDAAQGTAGSSATTSRADGVTVLVNASHLQHILINYLTNAAKYAGGATRIDVNVGATTVDVCVVDDGPGVPESLRDRLFERFVKGDDDLSRRHGTGLGLYIVRSLAEANGGQVWYRPDFDRGSCFAVRLERVGAA